MDFTTNVSIWLKTTNIYVYIFDVHKNESEIDNEIISLQVNADLTSNCGKHLPTALIVYQLLL